MLYLRQSIPKRAAIIAAITLFCLAAVLQASPAFAAKEYDDKDVKTAMLYNLISIENSFVWPPTAPEDMQVCSTGDKQSGISLPKLLAIVKKSGYKLSVNKDVAAEDLRSCRVLIINTGIDDATGIIKALSGLPILTVSETRGFASAGGMVQFELKDNKVKLVVNTASMKKAQIRISPDLLEIVRDVGRE